MENKFNSIAIIGTIYKWRKHFIIIVGISVVLSAIFSEPFFIKPKYKSEAIVYPINLQPYSGETPTEQLIQMFEAMDVTNDIIKKFNLGNHYRIKSKTKSYYSKLLKEFKSNISIKKTEYESVKIVVYDIDPDTASLIVQSFIDYVNKKITTSFRIKVNEVVKINKDRLESKRKEMDSMENVLQHLRINYEILDYPAQAREATKAQLKKISQSGKSSPKIDTLVKNLEHKGGLYASTSEHLWRIRGSYNDLKTTYENTINDYEKKLSYCTVVTSPYPADKKSYPIRWLIVLCTAVGTFVMMILIVNIVEKYKSFMDYIKSEIQKIQ
ncbi:MAG: Wzz/FepE/Etk N-terminal domain-containing protein [Bacteroidales bacterium]|jgi:capsular polysaccharide biosynthesis protein